MPPPLRPALPIAPAGAATQAGAGAAILIIGGVPKADAFAFAIAAQGMVILVGAALVGAAGIWMLFARFRPSPGSQHGSRRLAPSSFTRFLGGRDSMTVVLRRRVLVAFVAALALVLAGAGAGSDRHVT